MIQLLIYIFLFTISHQNPDAILGVWTSDDGVRTIEIFKEGNTFSGRLIRTNNQRLEKDLNKIVLTKLKYCPKENIWKNGRLVTPVGNLDASVSLLNEKKMKLEASKFFMTKTIYFNKV